MNLSDALFLVNPHSGGGRGVQLISELKQLLPDALVCDLLTIELEKILHTAETEQKTTVVCGGDGSISTVLDMVYEKNITIEIAVIPLGTGNDLARSICCRGPFDAPLAQLIIELEQAQPQLIDRMMVEGPGLRRSWYNYCSWGLDAEIALHFDRLRAQNRSLCRSTGINKLIYAALGLRMTGEDLSQYIESDLIVPSQMRSLLCANINSYAGGMALGPRVCSNDGLCDVFALPYAPRLLPVMAGRRRLRPVAQRAAIDLMIKRRLCMQCDGEAFYALPGEYRISCVGQVTLLSRQHIF